MYRQFNKLLSSTNKYYFTAHNRFLQSYTDLKDEVRFALETGKPIVALESTIITHGMPFPDNIKCALDVENVVKNQGATPATIAILNGRIKVGLSEEELAFLGNTKASNPIKTSRRDFPYVLSNKLNGGTTVCGTLIVANGMKIPIFATGGIGGVHRGAHKTFDISADLIELGKCGVAVVSSGVKSILDIPKTLEFLETQGVFVATFGSTKEFPAFYSRLSGSQAPYCVKSAIEAAKLIKCNRDMDLRSGMLFAVPIPEEFALNPNIINNVIEEALKENKHNINMLGKNVTPFLLSKVAQLTGGKSLESNMSLIKNNAKVASQIAVALSNLEEGEKSGPQSFDSGTHIGEVEEGKGKPLVIGGSNLDCSVNLATKDIKLDGRIYRGRFSYSAGGVGRNICDSLFKLGCPPNFISVVGDDEQGKLLKTFIPTESRRLVKTLKGQRTAQVTIVFDENGDCRLLMGDMQIHKEITPEMIKLNGDVIKAAPLIVLDANLSVKCMEEILKLATEYSIPVFFETTDVDISDKPFQTPYYKAVKIITPNLNELKYIASSLKIVENTSNSSILAQASYLAKELTNYIENVIVTLGSLGVLVSRKGLATEPFLKYQQRDEVYLRHYPCEVIKDVVNVSGAGDCFTSGIIAGILEGLSEEHCLSIGFAAAQTALYSQSAVPTEIFNKTHPSWSSVASFETINL